MKFIRASEKKRIIEELDERFGINEIPYLLIETGKEKIRAFSGNLSKEEIVEINKLIGIEVIGTYLLKKEEKLKGAKLRLSFDATHIFKEQIKKNIIELNENEFELWMKGNDLDIDGINGIDNVKSVVKADEGFVVIKHNDDFLGTGLSNGRVIFNYVPKERRVRK